MNLLSSSEEYIEGAITDDLLEAQVKTYISLLFRYNECQTIDRLQFLQKFEQEFDEAVALYNQRSGGEAET